jgi:hypothetical protein
MKLLCIKDFKMDGGEVAFIKGKSYDFNNSEFRSHFTVRSEISADHIMPFADVLGSFVSEAPEIYNAAQSYLVNDWWDKLCWLDDHSSIEILQSLNVLMENRGDWLTNVESTDFVINSYESYKAEANQKAIQDLLDKKSALELELAEINKQLGSV